MIDPYQPEVCEIVDGWMATEESKDRTPEFAIALSLRMMMMALVWLRQLVGPGTALMMAQGALESYRRRHEHECSHTECPLYRSKRTQQGEARRD